MTAVALAAPTLVDPPPRTFLEHWCREVEDAVSQVPWQDLWEEEHQEFQALLGEESPHVT